ncbi:hypothetical protein Hte_007748 [Hypoxylon texense]
MGYNIKAKCKSLEILERAYAYLVADLAATEIFDILTGKRVHKLPGGILLALQKYQAWSTAETRWFPSAAEKLRKTVGKGPPLLHTRTWRRPWGHETATPQYMLGYLNERENGSGRVVI